MSGQNIALPVHYTKKSRLERCDEDEALLQLVKILIATEHQTWQAFPEFGLRDLVAGAAKSADKRAAMQEALNRVLDEFEMPWTATASPAKVEVRIAAQSTAITILFRHKKSGRTIPYTAGTE